ncbi:hypothetical protein TWF106_009589 [Orbilia oligospora]|uniref:Uncharacterized protein n=1 Tax=Orbilia oligospora TaxID=2813651 RepID=A0A7C8QHD8_ORBOL|nr:hypothetical protein TWF106_009589 [Orbilia oligospora]
MTLVISSVVVLAFTPSSAAFEWNDFTNNLATDLAPLITLFGEQVTKQFLSESLSTWDNVIFAMAPLGILTAIVSAIRVCGSASLRAFIGRAQESPGTAEVELLSCTSETTSELWHEGGIARVFGAPQILQVVKVKSNDRFYEDSDKTAGIFLFSDACSTDEEQQTLPTDRITGMGLGPGAKVADANIASSPDSSTRSVNESHPRPKRPWTLVKGEEDDSEKAQNHRPNLSLNIGIKRQPKKFTYAAAAFGIILQGEQYAFPLTLSGTILIGLGMFLCGYIIEKTTYEVYYEQPGNETDMAQMYWVQPGGQKIGDQVFGSFIGSSKDRKYVKSSRVASRSKFDEVLWFTVIITIFGFVIQFVGLRGIHSSVIIAQLAATLIMAIVRAGLRSQRMAKETDILKRDNQEKYRNILQDHELDFLATKLEGIETMFVSPEQERVLLRTAYIEIFSLQLRKEGLTWKTDCSELEAILGIWAWSLLHYKANNPGFSYRLGKPTKRLIAAAPSARLGEAKTWYQVWVQRRLMLEQQNSIEAMANHFEDSELGSREDAYMCIIPILVRESKLPVSEDVFTAIQDQVAIYKNDGKWEDAEQLLQWVCDKSDVPRVAEAYNMLGGLYHSAMRHEEGGIRGIGFDGVCKLLKWVSETQNQRSDISTLVHQYGWIGLRIAMETQDDAQTSKLKSSGAKEDTVPDYTDNLQLWEWVEKDNTAVAKYLIGKKDYNVDEGEDEDGRNALSWAAKNGNFDITVLLLEKNADRNLHDDQERTPLSYAAENGHQSIAEILLKGDLNSINMSTKNDDKTALMLAAQNGHETIVELLLKK